MTTARTTARTSVADRVYEALKDDIFEFRLLPGDRFSEGDLAHRLGASRTPVREALYRLQREGFVDVLFRSGWQVQPLDFDQLDELYELRITLERAAAEKICTLREKPQTIYQLRRLWRPTDPAERAIGATACAVDESFHCELMTAAGNREMARIHRQVTERLRIVRRLDFTRQDRVDATYTEHRAILEALLAGDAPLARELLGSHIRHSQNTVREITMERLHEAAEAHRRAL